MAYALQNNLNIYKYYNQWTRNTITLMRLRTHAFLKPIPKSI